MARQIPQTVESRDVVMLLMNLPSIQRVPIDALRLPATPVRCHPPREIEKTGKLLAAHGQLSPLLAAADGEIIYNEAIWLALKANGASHVDVIVVPGKSPRELRLLQIALNRIPLDAIWDEQNVRKILEDLVSVDFDVELTGFDPIEIDSYLSLDFPEANMEGTASDVPPIQRAVSTHGTIWQMGKHRVGCGSALDLAFVNRVLDGKIARCAFIDPHNAWVQDSREHSSEYFTLAKDALMILKGSCAPAALVYACVDWRYVTEMTVAARACDMPLYNICVDTKPGGPIGGIYRDAHELVCVFNVGADSPFHNQELGRHGRDRSNVWSYLEASSVSSERDGLSSTYPSAKPLALIADILRDVTKRGDVVLDTFLGAGSTLMAAQQTGRLCCGIEEDPRYLDVAIRRWQKVTGRDAISTTTGERFKDLAQKLLGFTRDHP
jgi:hypothetical protein